MKPEGPRSELFLNTSQNKEEPGTLAIRMRVEYKAKTTMKDARPASQHNEYETFQSKLC
jgi:hypothetical protein